MKIQFLNGGLANQTFQYIFTKHYNLLTGGKDHIYLDDSYFALNTVHNGYELEKVFGLHPPMLSDVFDEEVWSYMLEERKKGKSIPTILCENGIPTIMLSEVANFEKFNPFDGKVLVTATDEYNPDVFLLDGDVYYHGYWICRDWMYTFKDEIQKDLTFPAITEEHNKRYEELIYSTKSVSMHIRRGDFVDLGWSTDIDVIRTISESFVKGAGNDWTVFVFSDDIEWCKKHCEEIGLNLFKDVCYVEGNVSGLNYRDMQLMSLCQGMIMSNSSFCYLAGLLNNRKELYINPIPEGREL